MKRKFIYIIFVRISHSPIVFVVEDFGAFEAILVMSTLPTDATNGYDADQDVGQNSVDDRRLHISTATTDADSAPPPTPKRNARPIDTSTTSHRKRTRQTLATNDVARHQATNNADNDDEELFGFGRGNESPDEIQRKRRKTKSPAPPATTPPPIEIADDDDLHGPPTPDIDLPLPSRMPTSIALHDDLSAQLSSHEDIRVEFAESDSIQLNLSENRTPVLRPRRRDHGVVVRNVMGELMNSPSTFDYGEVLADGSDVE